MFLYRLCSIASFETWAGQNSRGKSDFNVTFPLGNQRKSLSSTTSQYHDQTQEHEFVCFYAMSAHKNHFKKQKYGTESV